VHLGGGLGVELAAVAGDLDQVVEGVLDLLVVVHWCGSLGSGDQCLPPPMKAAYIARPRPAPGACGVGLCAAAVNNRGVSPPAAGSSAARTRPGPAAARRRRSRPAPAAAWPGRWQRPRPPRLRSLPAARAAG